MGLRCKGTIYFFSPSSNLALLVYCINLIECPGGIAFSEKGGWGRGALFRAQSVVN